MGRFPDRHNSFHGLIVVLMVTGALVGPLLGALALAGCEPEPRTVISSTGVWREVDPYPGAVPSTRCWVWGYDRYSVSRGGPVCVAP
jgi:hypothetical protein